MKKSLPLSVAVALLASIVLLGCGSQPNDSASGNPETPTASSTTGTTTAAPTAPATAPSTTTAD